MVPASYELAACPVCGAEYDDERADADAIRREVELLWEFHGRRLRPETPIARLRDRVAFSQRPPLRVARCPACTLVYRNPREREGTVTELYAGETPDAAVLDALFETQHAAYDAQAARLVEFAGASGEGLEVGSYVGGFLAAAAAHGWHFVGLDVNAATNDHTRRRGFTVFDGDLERWDAAGRRFSAVAIWNCLDQLPDPRAAVRHSRALLADGGALALRVPNGAVWSALRARLDGPAALVARLVLAHNNLLGFPYRQAFTVAALERLLGDAGFAIERVYGDALVPIADEWTHGWAALEERIVKGALRLLARVEAGAAPWLEVYARAR